MIRARACVPVCMFARGRLPCAASLGCGARTSPFGTPSPTPASNPIRNLRGAAPHPQPHPKPHPNPIPKPAPAKPRLKYRPSETPPLQNPAPNPPRILGKIGGVPALGPGTAIPKLPTGGPGLRATGSAAAREIQYSKVEGKDAR
jgi:hypothetical protein